MQITAQVTPESKQGKALGLEQAISATISYDFGADEYQNEAGEITDYEAALEAAKALFGAQAVYLTFEDGAIVTAQARVRDKACRIYQGKLTPEAAQAEMDSWKLGVIQRRSGVSKEQKVKNEFFKTYTSVEARQKALAELQAQIQAEIAGR